MKKIYVLFFSLLGIISRNHAQVTTVDTVTTVDYGKMPPVYFSDKVYWEKNYDSKNRLNFEGLKYNSCFIGAFTNYWDNGQVKTTGQYLQNTSGDRTNLTSRGLCSVTDGIWKNFDENGTLKSTITYNAGKIVKEE